MIIIPVGIITYFAFRQNEITLGSFTNLFSSSKPNGSQVNNNLFPVAPLLTDNTSGEAGTSTLNDLSQSNQLDSPNRANLSQMDVAGLFNINLGGKSLTALVDRSNSNLYILDNQNNFSRLSYTTLPAVLRAYWGNNKETNYILIQQLKDLEMTNTLGQFKASSSSEPVDLSLKTLNFSPLEIVVSPDKQKIAYLLDEGGKGVLYLSDWSLQKPEKIWSSNLTSWQIAFPNNNTISLTTKPAYDYPGISYLLDLKTKQVKTLLNNINGLTVLVSPLGDRLIYSKSLLSSFNLYSYNLKTKQSKLLEINTLPEKCVWQDNSSLYCAVPKNITPGRYPDDWYLGKISLADNIWKIDLDNNLIEIQIQNKGNYDLINLVSNKETGWLYAVDKNSENIQAFALKL